MRIFLHAFAAVVLMCMGCARHHDTVGAVRAASLRSSVGQRVTLVGIAEPRTLGAALRCDGFDVWIDELHDWPSVCLDQRVRVVGVLEERHDLPVFVRRPGEWPVQGIPVPEGTDMHEASRRYVVRNLEWSVLR